MPRWLKALRHVLRFPEVLRCVRATRNWTMLVPAYLGLRDLAYPFELEMRNKDRISLSGFYDLVTVWVIFFRGEYPVDPGLRTILDVGANIGAFTLYAARRAPSARIIALEPVKANFQILERHIELNSLGGRVDRHRLALGGKGGTRVIARAGEFPGQSHGLLPPGATGDVEEVPVLDLASFLKREGLGRIDLMKMDIEGGEYEVLSAAPPEAFKEILAIVMEYHPHDPRRYKTELFGLLRGAGFRLVSDDVQGSNMGIAFLRRDAS